MLFLLRRWSRWRLVRRSLWDKRAGESHRELAHRGLGRASEHRLCLCGFLVQVPREPVPNAIVDDPRIVMHRKGVEFVLRMNFRKSLVTCVAGVKLGDEGEVVPSVESPGFGLAAVGVEDGEDAVWLVGEEGEAGGGGRHVDVVFCVGYALGSHEIDLSGDDLREGGRREGDREGDREEERK